jgi:hypothetical protein
VTQDNTNKPATEETVSFKQCTTCSVQIPHGYLYKGEARMRVTLGSISMAKYLMEQLGEMGEVIEPIDQERILAEMRAVGIPDSLGEEKDLAYQEYIENRLLEMVLANFLQS